MAKRGNPNWKKGVSGNPAGKPKGCGTHPTFRSLVEQLKESHPQVMEWQHPDYGIINDPFEIALIQTVAAAQNGESWAIKELLDRGYGKPHQSMDIEHSGDQHVLLSFAGRRDVQPEGDNADDEPGA